MAKPNDTAPLQLKDGQVLIVARNQVLQAMAEFDRKGLREKPTVRDNRRGWSVEENGERYNPKWVLKLATDLAIGKFSTKSAKSTLAALGFKLEKADRLPDPLAQDDDVEGGEVEEEEEANELNFDIERNLQRALRANIEQLEVGLRVTDGGKEKGQIDITAEDKNGTTVVIELKVGEAGRRAIGQVLGYMGEMTANKKPVRGILVAKDFSPHAVAAVRVVPGLQLRKYNFKFTFEAAG